MAVPAEQSFGRIHFVVNESGTEANVSVQYATSSDGIALADSRCILVMLCQCRLHQGSNFYGYCMHCFGPC